MDPIFFNSRIICCNQQPTILASATLVMLSYFAQSQAQPSHLTLSFMLKMQSWYQQPHGVV